MAMPAPIRRRLEVVCPCSEGATGLLLSVCWDAWMRGKRWQRVGRMDGLEQARGILAPQPRTDVDICISSAGRVVGSSDDHRCEGIGNPTIPRLDRRCVENLSSLLYNQSIGIWRGKAKGGMCEMSPTLHGSLVQGRGWSWIQRKLEKTIGMVQDKVVSQTSCLPCNSNCSALFLGWCRVSDDGALENQV